MECGIIAALWELRIFGRAMRRLQKPVLRCRDACRKRTGHHWRAVTETQERIAQAFDDILRSPKCKDSQLLQSLLPYVVDESVKGNEDGLKERMIGIYVFGRRPDYHTTGDPIVRSRMGLRRKRLAQYYESDGGEEASVQIVIPTELTDPAFSSALQLRSHGPKLPLQRRSSFPWQSRWSQPQAPQQRPTPLPPSSLSVTRQASSHFTRRKTYSPRLQRPRRPCVGGIRTLVVLPAAAGKSAGSLVVAHHQGKAAHLYLHRNHGGIRTRLPAQ